MLPAGLAAIPDIVEGLQMSQHFDAASQKLMMEMSAMAESLDTGGQGNRHAHSPTSPCIEYLGRHSHCT